MEQLTSSHAVSALLGRTGKVVLQSLSPFLDLVFLLRSRKVADYCEALGSLNLTEPWCCGVDTEDGAESLLSCDPAGGAWSSALNLSQSWLLSLSYSESVCQDEK